MLTVLCEAVAHVYFGSISAAPPHGRRGGFTPNSCRADACP